MALDLQPLKASVLPVLHSAQADVLVSGRASSPSAGLIRATSMHGTPRPTQSPIISPRSASPRRAVMYNGCSNGQTTASAHCALSVPFSDGHEWNVAHPPVNIPVSSMSYAPGSRPSTPPPGLLFSVPPLQHRYALPPPAVSFSLGSGRFTVDASSAPATAKDNNP